MRLGKATRGFAAGLTMLVTLGMAGRADAAGVRAVPVATGLASPVGFTFARNGTLVYLERNTGWLRFRNLSTRIDRRIYHVRNINFDGERGALGVALHPDWPRHAFVYVYATRQTPAGLRNQVIRIHVAHGHGSGRILLSIPAGPASNHNGGRILFGPGGKLFIVVGDGAASANSQDLSSLKGKILRINGNGTIPKTNPFHTRVWAYGIRNSIGFTFDPMTNRLWETDNGPECNDEINLIRRGGNHGWGPSENCAVGTAPGNTNNSGPAPRVRPKAWLVSTIGITGAAFCDGCGLGAAFQGRLLVGAVNDGVIRRYTLNGARTAIIHGPAAVLDQAGPVLSMEVDRSGRIYFSDTTTIYRLAPA